MTKNNTKTISLFFLTFGFILNFLPNIQAAIKPASIEKKELVHPIISNVIMSKSGKLYPGDKVVATLKGKNLNLILSANLIQKMHSIGKVDIEKYTSTNGNQRRLILNINKNAKQGNFVLQLISKNKKIIKLPTQFKPTISSFNLTNSHKKAQ